MIKRMIIMLFLCALVLGGAFGYKIYGGMMMQKGMAARGVQPETVSTMVARYSEWQNKIEAVGTLHAVQGTDIAPEVAGTVETISFESGQDIEEGAPLIHLRSAEEQAALAALDAQVSLAELTMARDEKQLKAKAISQATYDADKANLENLDAQLQKQTAALDKKTILAPFAGRLGLRLVNLGTYIAAGTPIVSLQQLDPLYLDFTVPQQSLVDLALGKKITAQTDAYPDEIFEGEITAIDSAVDESTRNINVRATIQNPEKLLRPGLFAKLSLVIGEPHNYLTLPQTAVTFNPYGSVVYVADKDYENSADGAPGLKARMAFVKTGKTRGDQVSILDGIKEGDEIVTSGQLKIKNGSPIVINNAVQPKDDPNPKPEDK